MSVQLPIPETASPNGKKVTKKKLAAPWLAVICLIVSLLLFWGLPLVVKHAGPVQVDFEKLSK